MDVIERLTLEAAQADTMIACEHRHRYELAARLLAGRRVLDLCCGSGYGTQILAASAERVVGVDVDLATIELARATVGAQAENVAFEAADAVRFLAETDQARFDAIVCFEGLEHLDQLDRALQLLCGFVERSGAVIVSLPNDKLSGVHNAFHATEFGYDEAIQAFRGFGDVVMVPQFLAEGSLIVPGGATDVDVAVTLGDRLEPEYANHFIFCAGLSSDTLTAVHHGRIQVNASPVFNRWAEDLKQGAAALRRENARLGRERLGKAGSAAASALAGLAAREAHLAELEERVKTAEAREAALLMETPGSPAAESPGAGTEPVLDGVDPLVPTNPHARSRARTIAAQPLPIGTADDPNSWEWRRRRAAEVLLPWVEQTVSLKGKTVLEYGCGNGPVSCAMAARAGRVLGYDIDRAAVEEGRRELKVRDVANAQLEHQELGEIVDAVRSHRGEIDVFLLYAVLEHLTVAERLEVLALARETVREDGAIVVCETPNRLVYLDHHTAQMPFFHLLPDELAARCYGASPRRELREALAEGESRGEPALREAVARWGRGVSFHEFEVVFGDLGRHVIGSSYDALLFGERPIHPEEVVLARYLDRVRPDLAPAWSRQWLDVILSPRPVERRPSFIRPWTADTTESKGVGWTAWENLKFEGVGAVLSVQLPQPTNQVIIGSVAPSAEPLALQVRPQGGERVTVAVDVAPPYTGYTEFEFSIPVSRLTLRASRECHVVFIGYED